MCRDLAGLLVVQDEFNAVSEGMWGHEVRPVWHVLGHRRRYFLENDDIMRYNFYNAVSEKGILIHWKDFCCVVNRQKWLKVSSVFDQKSNFSQLRSTGTYEIQFRT